MTDLSSIRRDYLSAETIKKVNRYCILMLDQILSKCTQTSEICYCLEDHYFHLKCTEKNHDSSKSFTVHPSTTSTEVEVFAPSKRINILPKFEIDSNKVNTGHTMCDFLFSNVMNDQLRGKEGQVIRMLGDYVMFQNGSHTLYGLLDDKVEYDGSLPCAFKNGEIVQIIQTSLVEILKSIFTGSGVCYVNFINVKFRKSSDPDKIFEMVMFDRGIIKTTGGLVLFGNISSNLKTMEVHKQSTVFCRILEADPEGF